MSPQSLSELPFFVTQSKRIKEPPAHLFLLSPSTQGHTQFLALLVCCVGAAPECLDVSSFLLELGLKHHNV